MIVNVLKCQICLILSLSLLFDANNCLQCDNIPDTSRFNCFPENGANEPECLQRGCCWKKALVGVIYDRNHQIDNKPPECFFPKDFPNYSVIVSNTTNVYLIEKAKSTFRPNEILQLEVRVIPVTKETVRVQIVDPSRARYQVPGYENLTSQKTTQSDNDYQVLVEKSPFSIKITRKSTGKTLLVEFSKSGL
jgi:lysosomal alpha-glucosidase